MSRAVWAFGSQVAPRSIARACSSAPEPEAAGGTCDILRSYATLRRDQDEAARRGYPYVILVDPEGAAARAMKADYATYSLLVDRAGTVLFRGGVDSDRSHLREDATPYLKNAIDDVLAPRPVRLPEAKTLGCSLMFK